jgi:ABC-type transport system involved in cytochrome c biogenesis permease subunit
LAIAACTGYALLAWVAPHLRAPGLMVYLLYGLLILGIVLPTAYLAWTETDPEPRDDARP